MFTRAFRFMRVANSETTLINMDPGQASSTDVMNVEEAKDTYALATEDKFAFAGGMPKYYTF